MDSTRIIPDFDDHVVRVSRQRAREMQDVQGHLQSTKLEMPSDTLMGLSRDELSALVAGRHSQPHKILGPQLVTQQGSTFKVVRCFRPGEEKVDLVLGEDRSIPMTKIDPAGVFQAILPRERWNLPAGISPYKFGLQRESGRVDIEDPYRFSDSTTEMQRWLFHEGTLRDVAGLLGAHEKTIDGVTGFNFVTWAPNARRISVVGPFNDWDGRLHAMRKLDDRGCWEIFAPGRAAGELYKFEIVDAEGQTTMRGDPAAQQMELRPGTAAVTVGRSNFEWADQAFMEARAAGNPDDKPSSTLEIHLPSWKKGPDGELLNYRDIAHKLVDHCKDTGFTHVELMGLLEHPYDGSWGYQVNGYFAPTSRHGSPEDFKYFVNFLHQNNIGVTMDWVPAHFPKNTDSGLGKLDGTHLYDHQDDRQGYHKDWDTRIFNFGRNEVRAFLLGSLDHMLKTYHIDSVRIDAVASMVYRSYARNDGEWIPNKYGGKENLEAIDFLRQCTAHIRSKFPGALTIAEESTDWPVTSTEGPKALSCDRKWNMGFMNDALKYFATPHEYRGSNLDGLTWTYSWANSQKHVLAFSHDEVGNGKPSLLSHMPGDEWQKFANLRLLLGNVWSLPGDKLLFSGGEFGQRGGFDAKMGVDWAALNGENHRGVMRTYKELNRMLVEEPAMHERQFEEATLDVFNCDKKNAVVAYGRRGRNPAQDLIFVHNFTQNIRERYGLGVDAVGKYREVFNSDAKHYGGSGVTTGGLIEAQKLSMHDKAYSIEVMLPPLATVAFKRVLE